MTIVELIFVAIGVSMDAFAVGISKGLAVKKASIKQMSITGLYFGTFQALMPVIGYLLYSTLKDAILAIDHWVAFILLGVIGVNMIIESFKKEADSTAASFSFKVMLPLAIATSIDALAIGITFGALHVPLLPAVLCIGITTFLFSFFGVKIGAVFGEKYKNKAEFIGGIILIFIGFRILFEHLGIRIF